MQAYHTVTVGDSGSGKTTFLREQIAEFTGLVIVVNHCSMSGVDGRSQFDAATVESAAGARAADARVLNWRCSDPIDVGEDVRKFAREYYRATGYPAMVVVDEAQQALPDSEATSKASENPFSAMLHEDRDQGVKVSLATQDPTELYYPPVKQCAYIVWCGSPSPFHEGFARYYGLPESELPTQDYEYVVFGKEGSAFEWSIDYRGTTDPAYG